MVKMHEIRQSASKVLTSIKNIYEYNDQRLNGNGCNKLSSFVPIPLLKGKGAENRRFAALKI